MVKSKEWEWNEADKDFWTTPCEESYYYANKWKTEGKQSILDLGCGLGRQSILFAKEGFDVTAIDLSKEGIDYLNEWKEKAGLKILTKVCDMNRLPFPDDTFDCIWSYHVISHTDTEGILLIRDEIKRVLKPNGSIYFTLCSKETWSYKEAGFPRIDENTIMKTDGPEKNVPHFYVDLDNVIRLLNDFTILRIRHIDDCFFNGSIQNSRHYYIEAVLK